MGRGGRLWGIKVDANAASPRINSKEEVKINKKSFFS